MLCFAAIYLLSFTVSASPMALKLVSLKECYILVGAYLLGRHVVGQDGYSNLLRMSRDIRNLSVLVALTGLTLYVVSSDVFWRELGVAQFFQARFSSSVFWFLMDGHHTPPNFFTYIDGQRVKRVVAPLLDAPSLSRFYVVPIGLILSTILSRSSSKTSDVKPYKSFLISDSFARYAVSDIWSCGNDHDCNSYVLFVDH